MMISGSTPFSLAMASICWSRGLVVAIYQLSAFRYQLSARRCSWVVPSAGAPQLTAVAPQPVLELDVEPAAFDRRQRHAVHLAPFFQQHHAVVEPGEPSGKGRLAFDRSNRDQLGQPSLKPPVICFVPQRPIEPG